MTQLETSTRSSHNVLHGMMVGVFLNGNLHWLASKKPEVSDSVIILAFNVSTEEFQEIQLPLIANREEKVSKKFEGCLRLTNCDDQWKFNEYKEMYMMKNITKYYKAMRLRDGEFLLWKDKELNYYEPQKETLRPIKIVMIYLPYDVWNQLGFLKASFLQRVLKVNIEREVIAQREGPENIFKQQCHINGSYGILVAIFLYCEVFLADNLIT